MKSFIGQLFCDLCVRVHALVMGAARKTWCHSLFDSSCTKKAKTAKTTALKNLISIRCLLICFVKKTGKCTLILTLTLVVKRFCSKNLASSPATRLLAKPGCATGSVTSQTGPR